MYNEPTIPNTRRSLQLAKGEMMYNPCSLFSEYNNDNRDTPQPKKYDISTEKVLNDIRKYLENLPVSVDIIDPSITGNNRLVVTSDNYRAVDIIHMIFYKFNILPNSIFYENEKMYVGYLWYSWS